MFLPDANSKLIVVKVGISLKIRTSVIISLEKTLWEIGFKINSPSMRSLVNNQFNGGF